MTNSWKIGAVSGLIAGIIAAIVGIITALINFNIATYWYLPPPPITPLTKIVVTELTIGIIWGIVIGVIYSKIYDLIPGKDVWKGLVYGLGLYLILNIRIATIAAAYGLLPDVIAWITGIFAGITYGLVLGIFFKFLRDRYGASQKELEITRYDLKGGVQPGAIAGIVDGTVVFVCHVVAAYIGFFEWIPGQLTDIEFLMGQLGTHIVFNMFWWAIFGALYAMFYDSIPGKGIMKALYFSMTVFFITSFRVGVYFLAYGFNVFAVQWIVIGFFAFATAGPVLGYLYKK